MNRMLIAVLAWALGPWAAHAQDAALAYPDTREGDVVEDYHGTPVADPYRWLEDTDSEETTAWVEAQNAVTFAYLNALPERDALRTRLEELYDSERYGMPWKEAGRY
ncbi:MAG: hypothetical protein R3314_15155, partial [Longimicrobiales bacterium]|nr:hypothetical protein [Longimicrobiales bacterium]